jgi:hypothetical protein
MNTTKCRHTEDSAWQRICLEAILVPYARNTHNHLTTFIQNLLSPFAFSSALCLHASHLS